MPQWESVPAGVMRMGIQSWLAIPFSNAVVWFSAVANLVNTVTFRICRHEGIRRSGWLSSAFPKKFSVANRFKIKLKNVQVITQSALENKRKLSIGGPANGVENFEGKPANESSRKSFTKLACAEFRFTCTALCREKIRE